LEIVVPPLNQGHGMADTFWGSGLKPSEFPETNRINELI
jgi:hypothetical protein